MNRKKSKGGGKKPRVEVVFDPDARKDYLTGFHKRKQARRRFGLAMQEIKDRKERLEERKERREAMKERREELGVQEDLESFDIKAKAREEAKAKADELVQVDFEDGHTQAMFGDTVTVTTVVGIPDSDDEEDARETARLEKELLQEKKRKRAEKLAGWNGVHGGGGGGGGAGRGPGRRAGGAGGGGGGHLREREEGQEGQEGEEGRRDRGRGCGGGADGQGSREHGEG
eukprot:g4186.t1